MNKQTIEYYKRNVYGNEHKYVKDKAIQSFIATLTGTKTISDRDITALGGLGFKLVQVLPE